MFTLIRPARDEDDYATLKLRQQRHTHRVLHQVYSRDNPRVMAAGNKPLRDVVAGKQPVRDAASRKEPTTDEGSSLSLPVLRDEGAR